jgi:hypothetical protein
MKKNESVCGVSASGVDVSIAETSSSFEGRRPSRFSAKAGAKRWYSRALALSLASVSLLATVACGTSDEEVVDEASGRVSREATEDQSLNFGAIICTNEQNLKMTLLNPSHGDASAPKGIFELHFHRPAEPNQKKFADAIEGFTLVKRQNSDKELVFEAVREINGSNELHGLSFALEDGKVSKAIYGVGADARKVNNKWESHSPLPPTIFSKGACRIGTGPYYWYNGSGLE